MALKTEYSAKLLIVDDDATIRRVVKECFLDEGYDVWTAADGMQMRTILEKNLFDIILLDLCFPGKDDGIDLMREVRSKSNVPVIIISARSDLTDKIVALEVGADDLCHQTLRAERNPLPRQSHFATREDQAGRIRSTRLSVR